MNIVKTVLIFTLFMLLSCGGKTDEGIRLVTSINPISLISAELLPRDCEILTLVKPGESVHDHSATVEDMRSLSSAKALILAGGGLDDWVLGSVPRENVFTFFSREETDDPHFWVSPRRTLVRLKSLSEFLEKKFTEKSRGIAQRFFRAEKSLISIDGKYEKLAEELSDISFFMYHPAWNYLKEDYGMNMTDYLHKGHSDDPGARKLARIIDKMLGCDQPVFILEEGFDRGEIENIRKQVPQLKIVVLDPLGYSSSAESYTGLLEHNYRKLLELKK